VDSRLRLLIGTDQIAAKVRSTAHEIQKEFQKKDLVIVMVLKGALCLVADLIRQLDFPFDIEVVQCSSYGARGTERGGLQIFGLERLLIANRDVLIVDDIFDSGTTLTSLVTALQRQSPRSLQTCVLLRKKVPREHGYQPDYVLFDIENEFVVGYGLDYKERYRGLPAVYVLQGER
jgi:hypoxanthine phosphoribosyltransferase